MPGRPVYAVFRRDGVRNVRPLARWRGERAALSYADALERDGVPVAVLYRDEDAELGEPAEWETVYARAGPERL